MSIGYQPTFRLTEFRLLLVPAVLAIIGMLMIVLVPTGQASWSWSDIWISLVFGAAVIGINVVFGLRGFRGDQILLPIVATLAMIGMLTIQRLVPDLARIDPNYSSLAQKQFLFLMVGLAIMSGIVVLAGPLRVLSWLNRYAVIWLMLGFALQVLTVVIGTGPPGSGANLWLSLGPVQIQPSEVVKILLVVYMASYLDKRRAILASNQAWKVGRIALPPIPWLVPAGGVFLVALALLVVNNDLGSALMFFAILMVMLYLASGQGLYVIAGSGVFSAACYLAWRFVDRIGLRVQNWLDPWQDPFIAGYQPIQSDYALASGGILGTGFAQGSPWLVPIVETDYVLAAIGEELGLLGTLAVLALFMLLVVRGFLIAIRVEDGFAQLLAAGLSALLGIQTIIIVGGVLRVIPLTGITLPFISYGGSSLLSSFAIAGLLLHVSSLPKRV